MTSEQRRAALYSARRYLCLSPAEWDALPAKVQQIYLTQPIGDED